MNNTILQEIANRLHVNYTVCDKRLPCTTSACYNIDHPSEDISKMFTEMRNKYISFSFINQNGGMKVSNISRDENHDQTFLEALWRIKNPIHTPTTRDIANIAENISNDIINSANYITKKYKKEYKLKDMSHEELVAILYNSEKILYDEHLNNIVIYYCSLMYEVTIVLKNYDDNTCSVFPLTRSIHDKGVLIEKLDGVYRLHTLNTTKLYDVFKYLSNTNFTRTITSHTKKNDIQSALKSIGVVSVLHMKEMLTERCDRITKDQLIELSCQLSK